MGMVIDNRALNKLIIYHCSPGTIDIFFEILQGSQCFTSFDAASGFL